MLPQVELQPQQQQQQPEAQQSLQVPEQLPIVVSSSDNSYVSAIPIINNNDIISTTATTTSSTSTTESTSDPSEESTRFVNAHKSASAIVGSLRSSNDRYSGNTIQQHMQALESGQTYHVHEKQVWDTAENGDLNLNTGSEDPFVNGATDQLESGSALSMLVGENRIMSISSGHGPGVDSSSIKYSNIIRSPLNDLGVRRHWHDQHMASIRIEQEVSIVPSF